MPGRSIAEIQEINNRRHDGGANRDDLNRTVVDTEENDCDDDTKCLVMT